MLPLNQPPDRNLSVSDTTVQGESDPGSMLLAHLNNAQAAFTFQNVQAVQVAVISAQAIYDETLPNLSREERLLLMILKNMVTLFLPLTRVLTYQTEGRFQNAFDEIDKGRVVVRESQAALEELSAIPGTDPEVIRNFRPILSIFPVLFDGIEASSRAETFGYRGDMPKYRQGLAKAVAAFRMANKLPASVNPMFQTLSSSCNAIADRLEVRMEVFAAETSDYMTPTGEKVFIIHGHDEGKWRELESLLRELGVEPIVLSEQPNQGRTLIDKFESYAFDCCYAFALVTPDDFVKKGNKSYFQPRPNVLVELGWFFGRFGRDRLCILTKGKAELPSDLAGIVYHNFNERVSERFKEIKAELVRGAALKPN